MRNDWIFLQKEKAKLLLSQESTADFLKHYYEFTKTYWPVMSYSWLAREIGVSKSLVLGIFNGSKSLSPKNVSPLLSALSLPQEVGDYLETLTTMEEGPKKKKILKNLRQSFLDTIQDQISLDLSISDPDFAILYAALGEEENGSTIEEISHRIRWSEERIRFLLNELRIKRLVKVVSDTHWKGTKKFLTAIANNKNTWLPKLFHSTLERHQNLAKANFFSQDHLSLTYTFCVSEQDRIAMNTELREVMGKLMKKYHDGQGDKVISLVLGTHVN